MKFDLTVAKACTQLCHTQQSAVTYMRDQVDTATADPHDVTIVYAHTLGTIVHTYKDEHEQHVAIHV